MLASIADLVTPAPLLAPVGASLAVLAVATAVGRVAVRRAAEGPLKAPARRRLRLLKGACGLLAALALGALWSGELGAVALQLAAFTMAIVMAFKELVLCATGSLLRIGGAMYRIGDVVEIDGMLGEVTDGTWLTTHVAELRTDSFGRRATGRARVLPNSRLFSADVRVEHVDGGAVFHAFSITGTADTNAARALEILDAAVARATAPFADAATAAGARAGRRLHQRLDAVPGRVAIATTEIGLPRFDVLLFCPADAIHALERRIRLELAGGATATPGRPVFADGLRLVAG